MKILSGSEQLCFSSLSCYVSAGVKARSLSDPNLSRLLVGEAKAHGTHNTSREEVMYTVKAI